MEKNQIFSFKIIQTRMWTFFPLSTMHAIDILTSIYLKCVYWKHLKFIVCQMVLH